jgi:hypothetical protein
VADSSKKKCNSAGAKAIPQHEADAQLLSEKTARLRELRLAHEAANAGAGSFAVAGGQKSIKKKSRKAGEKAPSLSDWLATQQNEGRRG